MLGEPISALGLPRENEGLNFRRSHLRQGEAVLPFDRFEGADAILGPKGDALHRRGHGHRARLPHRVRQGSAAAATARRCRTKVPRSFQSTRLRQGRRLRGSRQILSAGKRLSHPSPRSGTAAAIQRMGVRAQALNKDRRGLPARRRLDRAAATSTSSSTPPPAPARSDRRLADFAAPRVARGIPCLTTLAAGASRRTRDLQRPCRGWSSAGALACRSSTVGATPSRSVEMARATEFAVMALALFGRRLLRVAAVEEHGALHRPARRRPRRPRTRASGQFAMLAAAEGWGAGRTSGRTFRVPFPAPAGARGESHFLLEDVGPGTHRLGALRAGDPVLWALGPLGAPASALLDGRRAILLGGGRRHRAARRSGRTLCSLRARPSCSAFATARARPAPRCWPTLKSPPTTAPSAITGSSPKLLAGRADARRARNRLCLRARADARGRAALCAARGGARAGSRWRPAWPVASAPATAASCRAAAAATLRVCLDGPVVDAASRSCRTSDAHAGAPA